MLIFEAACPNFYNVVFTLSQHEKPCAIKKASSFNAFKRRLCLHGCSIPDDILWRQKAAFSDAVGHSMVDDLKEYAESLYSDEAFAKGCEKYSFAKPFTKESLLYRDIFEKYYPGQAEMVKDFWMPNKSWKGCDVQDPSARVLSNYGASGV